MHNYLSFYVIQLTLEKTTAAASRSHRGQCMNLPPSHNISRSATHSKVSLELSTNDTTVLQWKGSEVTGWNYFIVSFQKQKRKVLSSNYLNVWYFGCHVFNLTHRFICYLPFLYDAAKDGCFDKNLTRSRSHIVNVVKLTSWSHSINNDFRLSNEVFRPLISGLWGDSFWKR